MAQEIHDEINALLSDVDESTSVTLNNTSSKEDEDAQFEALLKEFISSEMTEEDTEVLAQDYKEAPKYEGNENNLAEEENSLYSAYQNFSNSIIQIAEEKNISLPKFKFDIDMLRPRYKPYVGKTFAKDILVGWDTLIKAYPEKILDVNPQAKDEELLNFAESLENENLQMAIISYVEVLIELEGCEIAYEKRRLKAKRKKIEKDIILEHQKRVERIKKYTEAIQKAEYPVDAERLVKNYFKTSRNDAEGAFKMLTQNPATFAPIEVQKIKDRFFGLIKAKPEDGIRINKELGNFLKKLKV